MAQQNNGFNFNGNATCIINNNPARSYSFGEVRPNNALDAEDMIHAHLTGVNAMLTSVISDPEYEADRHLLSILYAAQLNVSIAIDAMDVANAKIAAS